MAASDRPGHQGQAPYPTQPRAEAISQILADAGLIPSPVIGTGVCFPTDHAGVVAQLRSVPGQLKR